MPIRDTGVAQGALAEVASYDLVVSSPSYAAADGQLYAAHASGVDVPYAWKDLPHVLLGGDRLSILPGDALADLTSGPWTDSSAGKAAKLADGPLTITAGAYGEWLTAGPAEWIAAGVKRVAIGIKASRGAGRPAVCIWSAPEEGGTTRGLWVDLYSSSGDRVRFVTSNGTTLQGLDGGPVDYDADAPVWVVVDWSQADALSRSAPSWARSALGHRQAQMGRADMTSIGGFDGHLWVAPNLDVGGTGTLSLEWLLILDATGLEV